MARKKLFVFDAESFHFGEAPRKIGRAALTLLLYMLLTFTLAVLAYLAFDRYQERRWPSVLWAAVAFLAGCAYAAGTEWVQSRLSYRSGDPADFLADFSALAACSVVILILIFAKHKK